MKMNKMIATVKSVCFQNALILMILLISPFTIFAQEQSIQANQKAENSRAENVNDAAEILRFENQDQKDVYQSLILELRCPKCQNQNIADSNADIAKDLRNKVYELTLENKDKAEIKEFMLSRFGEFVLYKPQFSGKTMLLWLLPIFILFVVIFLVVRLIIRNAKQLENEIQANENDNASID